MRIRWRAAHALRRFAAFGQREVLDGVISQYDRRVERSFRAPSAPFDRLAARLWTVIVLDRIAAENPSEIRHQAEWLMSIATGADFPHILIREYAKTAALKLLDGQNDAYARKRQQLLSRTNVSRRKRKAPPRPGARPFRGRGEGWGDDERRFHFDPMDTLPYWYSPAVDLFADASPKEFLDIAEAWIVDKWGVDTDVWSWKAEARRDRFSERDGFAMDHRHGELPRIERSSTHLEWNAMWCAAGTFLESHALLAPDDFGESWESWVARSGKSSSRWWLADLCSPKPLHDRFWFSPAGDKANWLHEITDEAFLRELQLVEYAAFISVNSYYSTKTVCSGLSAHIETAFVFPGTALALVRALQTADDPTAYRVPPAGDDLRNRIGAVCDARCGDDYDRSAHFDEHHPLRYDVSGAHRSPSAEVLETLDLRQGMGPTEWVREGSSVPIMFFEEWG